MAESTEAATVEVEVTQDVYLAEEKQPKVTDEAPDGPQGPELLPHLTYIDFVPQCLGSNIEGKEPMFAQFGTLLEQANQWLLSMPKFSVHKCETINLKLGVDYSLDNDLTLVHTSSHGKNTYLRILRVWLIPKSDLSLPTQQIAYITILPDHSSGDVITFLQSLGGSMPTRTMADMAFPAFNNLTETVEKLNKHLRVKPLPGRILTVETLTFKCQESNNTDTLEAEGTCWSESGANAKLYLNALRIYYVVGRPAFETIGIKDQVPEMYQNMDALGQRVKFATTGQTISTAANWLQAQHGIRVVNAQSLNIKLEQKFETGPWLADPSSPGYIESQAMSESRYVKILRIAYVKEPKMDTPSLYNSVTLTSRLFVPNRSYGKTYETFSRTMLYVIKWLNATRIPVFACETVYHRVNSIDGDGAGFNENKPDYQINNYNGQHYITCIRLYFPSVFQEPPPDIPDVDTSGWGCVVS